MMDRTDSTRLQGVDLSELVDATAVCEYPIACTEVVDRYGDYEVEHANGRERIADVLGPIDDTFESTEEICDAVISTVGMDAVGRSRYTDRGGETPEERDSRSMESF